MGHLQTLRPALFVGAACADATPEQEREIRAMWAELREGFLLGSVPARKIEERVRDTMGPDWEPGASWAELILESA